MIMCILCFPLMGAILAGLWGRKLGSRGSGYWLALLVFCGLLVLLRVVWEIREGGVIYVELESWVKTGFVEINWGFYVDYITVAMMFIIMVVSGLVHLYSIGYMEGDPHVSRFMSYLSLFTFFMLVLVTGHNYFQLFIGWEGVGLCSYLLINFWGTRLAANKAAIKAMLVNRVGDMGLIIGMIFLLNQYDTLEYGLLSVLYEMGGSKLEIIGFCLLVGAVGKSAQLGLHTWLPDAMEGPTPVSALIHAATMVTAGVFLIIRSADLFVHCSAVLILMGVIGGLTAFFAGTVGLVQGDLKKVIAYSTCSQLGLMVLACGCLCFSSALYHLVNHAFFKALLFLSAGSLIHGLGDEQDMRKFGGFRGVMPITYVGILVGSLSLMGVPYLTGFYSKDVGLELVYGRYMWGLVYWLGVGSVCLTGAYSGRLIYLVFFGRPRGSWLKYRGASEGSWCILIPLVILSIGSIIVGYGGKEFFLSSEFVPVVPSLVKWLPLIFGFLGATGAGSIYVFWINMESNSGVTSKPQLKIYNKKLKFIMDIWRLKFWYFFLNLAWRFKEVMSRNVLERVLKFGYSLFKWVDSGVLEYFGPKGIGAIMVVLGQAISRLQGGEYTVYILIMFWCVGLVYVIGLGIEYGVVPELLNETGSVISFAAVLEYLYVTGSGTEYAWALEYLLWGE